MKGFSLSLSFFLDSLTTLDAFILPSFPNLILILCHLSFFFCIYNQSLHKLALFFAKFRIWSIDQTKTSRHFLHDLYGHLSVTLCIISLGLSTGIACCKLSQ